MANLQLALIGPWPPYRGGIAQFGTQLAYAMRERGHVVHPISFKRQYPEFLFPGTSQIEKGSLPADLPQAPRLLDTLSPWSWRKTGQYIRRLALDAVIFQHWMPFFAPAYGSVVRTIGSGGPSRIVLAHNALPHERRPGDVMLSRRFLGACDSALALSASVKQDVERLVPDLPVTLGSHPVYNQFGPAIPLEDAHRQLGIPEGVPVLLFFGFIRRYKGLDVLIEAVPDILERHPETVVIVAGEFYEDPQPYRKRVEELGIGNAIRFEDRYLPASDVAAYFSAADLVVQSYRSATQSGVALTAFGFGVPVITTDVGGLAENVPDGDAGLVVPPENPAALAAAVNRVLDDSELADKLSSGAVRVRDEHTWDALCEKIEGLIGG